MLRECRSYAHQKFLNSSKNPLFIALGRNLAVSSAFNALQRSISKDRYETFRIDSRLSIGCPSFFMLTGDLECAFASALYLLSKTSNFQSLAQHAVQVLSTSCPQKLYFHGVFQILSCISPPLESISSTLAYFKGCFNHILKHKFLWFLKSLKELG